MIASPGNLELLLHCHYSARNHERSDAPAIIEGIRMLSNADMIETRDGIWRTTERGAAFIEHLMTIPFPVAKWVIPTAKTEEG